MSATPLLRRFDIVTFKNKSGSDTAQVPTAATVNIYRQGATYRGSTITISPSDPDPTTIDVDDIGDIVVSDTLGTNTATACFIVNAIISTTQLQLSSISGSQTLSDNDRLVVTTNQPTIYSDSRGNTSTSNPLTADGATGRAQVYVKNKRFDYIVTGLGTGVPARLFRNAEGGSIPEAFLNLNDYASLKQAIAALPATGGKILAPQGTYTLDGSDLEVAFNKPIHLIGAGAGATTFQVQATAGNKNKDLFRIESAFCSIEDCRLVGVGNQGGSPGSGVGIKIGYPNDPEVKVYGIVIRNVIVQDFANYNIMITGGELLTGYGTTDQFTIDNTTASGAQSGAQIYIGSGCTEGILRNVRLYPTGELTSPSGVPGLVAVNVANLTLDTCEGSPPDDDTYVVWIQPSGSGTYPDQGATGCIIRNCDFEYGGPLNNRTRALVKAEWCAQLVCLGNLFYRFGTGIELIHCHQPILLGNTFKVISPGNHVVLDSSHGAVMLGNAGEGGDGDDSRGHFVDMLYDDTTSIGTFVIQTYGTSPNCNLQSVRLPNLTSTQRNAITNVRPGMLIFNTDSNQIEVAHNGATWGPVP